MCFFLEMFNSEELLLKYVYKGLLVADDSDHHVRKSSDVGVSLSSFTIDTISARHNGQCCNCDAHVIQKPLELYRLKVSIPIESSDLIHIDTDCDVLPMSAWF